MFFPFSFEAIDGESRKQFLAARKVVVERAYQKRFPETSRTCEEINLAFLSKLVNQVRLINVNSVEIADFRKCLNANGKFASHTDNI